jgi:hypothetical protein
MDTNHASYHTDRDEAFLFGFFFVYLLGGGILIFRLGWIPAQTLPLYLISGGLFFLSAVNAYRFKRG